jgi:predicted dehydrogenase
MSVLVVGGGKMGLSHLAILSRIGDHRSVSLCEPSRVMRYVYRRFNYRTFANLDSALKSPIKWAGAVIATPTMSHYTIAKTLIERSIPCFIEKPLTLNPLQSQELVNLREKTGAVAQLGLVTRFMAAFIKLRWIIESNALGAPLSYEAKMLGNVITKSANNGWRTVFSRGGGCLNEYGPHLIDLCRYFFGDVDKIDSATIQRTFSCEADDSVDVAWIHSSGCTGHLALDWCDASKRKSSLTFEVKFERGTVRANNADVHIDLVEGAIVPADLKARLFSPVLPHPVSFYLRGEEYSLQLEVFLERISGRKIVLGDDLPHDTAATLKDGLEVDKLINEIAMKVGLA